VKGNLAQQPRTPDTKAVPSAVSDAAAEVGLISMVQLLAKPQEFNGKRLQVIGFIHLEFEGNAVYLSQEDFQHGIDKNGLWLSISETELNDLEKINNSYAVVEGTFNAKNKGHVGMWSGSIENITKFKLWAKARASKIR